MSWITETKELITEYGVAEVTKAVDRTDLEAILALVEDNPESFHIYAKDVGLEYAAEAFEEAFCGAWDSERAFAEDLFDDLHLHEVPDHIARYIDYDAFARDLFIADYVRIDGYVFRRM